MSIYTRFTAGAVLLWCSMFAFGAEEQAALQPAAQLSFDESVVQNVSTINHEVQHTSTVPANLGEEVKLAVRERVVEGKEGKPFGKAVLFVHGATVASPPVFELRVDHYDWAGYLAKSGFDVFMIDHQGSGLSPRPKMDDPCNTDPAEQSILIPNPLLATCPVEYKFQLTNSQSDWDELDTVIKYIKAYRGVEKVALIGYSQGSFRVGPYAIQHPDKVDSVLFLSPIFNPNGRASKAGTRFDAPVTLPVGSPAIQFGFPMRLTTKTELNNAWNIEVQCQGQQAEGVYDHVWSSIMENDMLGRTWGGIFPMETEGVIRVRNPFLWGWNNTTVKFDSTLGGSVPVLIIYGEHDRQVIANPFSVTALYDAIPGSSKLSFKVACSGHFMAWEGQRRVLHHISKQWLKHGLVDGFTTGRFFVDTEGNISPL
jgi:pimeloyl-ACP methyl ester carboxylesterase